MVAEFNFARAAREPSFRRFFRSLTSPLQQRKVDQP
jgi:hypothetical protein